MAEASNKKSAVPIDNAILSMSHRGRLATLIVLNDYPMRNLLYKVKGNNDIPKEIHENGDDIPTHIAVSNNKTFSHGIDF